MSTQPHDLYRRWLTELWGGDFTSVPELVADDFVGHWPDRDVRGREDLVAMIEQARAMFSELTYELESAPHG